MNYWIKCILYIKRWFNINLYQFSIPYPLCIIHKSVAAMKSIHPNPTTRLVMRIECCHLYIAVWNSFQIASNQNLCHQDTQLHTLVNCRMNCTKLIGGEGNVTIPVKESQQRDDYKEMQWIPTMSRKNRKDVYPPNECVILPSPAQKDIPSQALCERRRVIKKEWCMIHANKWHSPHL